MEKLKLLSLLLFAILVASCATVSPKQDILNTNKAISVVSLYPEEGKLFKVATIFNSKEDPFIFKGHEDFNTKLEVILEKKLIEKGYTVKKLDTDGIRERVGNVMRGQDFYGHTFDSEGDLKGELENQSSENSVDFFLIVAPSWLDPCFRTDSFLDTYGIINRSLGFDLGSRIFVSAFMAVVVPGSLSPLKYSKGDRCTEIPDAWGKLENLNKTTSDPEFSEKMYRALEESYLDAFGKMKF